MKNTIRKELRQKRALLENREYLSSLIADTFLSTDLYQKAEILLLYCSVSSEVSTEKIFSKALNDNKKVAFPLCLDNNGVMEFYYVNDIADLEEGMYGIKAPKRSCEKYTNSENTLCIVPGLAFDKKGYRLGYGKGYYDRFLENFNGISAGLCFEAMLEEILPTDKFDKKTDYLITDKKIYKFTD